MTAEGRGDRRALAVLATAQAAGLSGGPLVVLVGGILGGKLAPAPTLATVPVVALVLGLAAGTLPAAAGTRMWGRRRALALGSAVATVGCVMAALGAHTGRFLPLCVGILLVGGNLACVQQYRFAAAEAAIPGREAGAVSVVMAAGILGGVLGPALATAARSWTGTPWAGSFLALGGTYAAVTSLLLLGLAHTERPAEFSRTVRASGQLASPPPPPPRSSTERSARGLLLGLLLSRPRFRLALAAGMTSFAVMILIMSATPLAMQLHGGHGVEATARVIQAHSVAMYAPSLLTGILIASFGTRRLMLAGVAAMSACAVVAMGGTGVQEYWTALVLLGLGWNLLFVAGTVELSRSCEAGEAPSAQGFNDFLVFGAEALAALCAGTLLRWTGWTGVNVTGLTVLAFMLVVLITHRASSPAGRPHGLGRPRPRGTGRRACRFP